MVLAVALVPASARPYVGGSTDNTVLQLAIGYNGVTRILGRGLDAGERTGIQLHERHGAPVLHRCDDTTIVATAVWSGILLHRNVFGPTWLPWTLAGVSVLAAAAVLGLGTRRIAAPVAVLGLLAAALEVSSGTPGRGGLTPAREHVDVIFGHRRSSAHTREIAERVADHYRGTVIGGSTVYRLT